MKVYGIDNPVVARCISAAFHQWCRRHRSRRRGRWMDPHPRVFGSGRQLVAEKPDDEWFILLPDGVPMMLVVQAAYALEKELRSRCFLTARDAIVGALAYSHSLSNGTK